MNLQDYITQVQELVHDSSGIDYTQVEMTNFVNNARTRVALDFHCVRKLFYPLTTVVNQEIYPMNGAVGGASVVSGGVGYTNQTSVVFWNPGGAGVQAIGSPIINNGVITGINMTNWGSGYSSIPPPGWTLNVTSIGAGSANVCSLALGTGGPTSALGFASGDTVTVAGVVGCTEANGVWVIDVIFGGGSPPTIARVNLRGSNKVNNWISGGTLVNQSIGVFIQDPGGGLGATGSSVNSALINVMDLVSVSVLNGTFRTTLGWMPFTKFQAFCRANPTISGQPLIWSNYTEQNRVFLYPALPDQNYVMEWDAVIGTTTPLVNLSDTDTQILNPMADCVQFYAAHLALLKMQNFEQAEYYNKKYEARQMRIQLTRQTVRTPNVYQNNWRRVQRGS